MADCYALNVPNNHEMWCYYYTEFPLVCVRGLQDVTVWHPPIHGSGSFTIWQNWAFFQGGYEDHESYYLVELGASGHSQIHAHYRLHDQENAPLQIDAIASRGQDMFFLGGATCYRVRLSEVLEQAFTNSPRLRHRRCSSAENKRL